MPSTLWAMAARFWNPHWCQAKSCSIPQKIQKTIRVAILLRGEWVSEDLMGFCPLVEYLGFFWSLYTNFLVPNLSILVTSHELLKQGSLKGGQWTYYRNKSVHPTSPQLSQGNSSIPSAVMQRGPTITCDPSPVACHHSPVSVRVSFLKYFEATKNIFLGWVRNGRRTPQTNVQERICVYHKESGAQSSCLWLK